MNTKTKLGASGTLTFHPTTSSPSLSKISDWRMFPFARVRAVIATTWKFGRLQPTGRRLWLGSIVWEMLIRGVKLSPVGITWLLYFALTTGKGNQDSRPDIERFKFQVGFLKLNVSIYAHCRVHYVWDLLNTLLEGCEKLEAEKGFHVSTASVSGKFFVRVGPYFMDLAQH